MRHLARLLSRLVPLGLVSCFTTPIQSSLDPSPRYPPPPPPAPGQQQANRAPVPPPPPVRDDGRLPPTVTPVRASLVLAIDPTRERFSGSERIVVTASAPTFHVVLNAHALHLQQASVVIKGGERFEGYTTARVAHGGFEPEELVLTFDPPIPAGEARIDLTWDAPYSPNLMGLSREEEGGRWYAFTDLEPTHARNVFPGFDEPSYKIPYDVSVVVPRGMSAFGNGAETKREDTASGTTTFTFAPTPPLPSYLVAVAVGDLDVESAASGSAPVPLRLLAAKGKGKLGALSLEEGGALTRALGDYFGMAYPYPKLDLVAVPDFAPGAMENAGLITFREQLLLVDPAHSSATVRSRQREVIAHELAHQWFGDLVTLAWWNDSWLNEGFARWAQTKVVERIRPESRATLERLGATDQVMNEDALGSARAVRQPVRSAAEATESFDHITYDKGAAILAMIEARIGEDTFRRVLHDYLVAHAWGNTTAPDLFAAFEKGSGKPVGAVAASFVDRTGVPEVAVTLSCKAGGWSVELAESTWKPLGSAADGEKPASWQVPACIRVAGQKDTECVELGESEPRKTVTGSGPCPAYVQPNVAMKGYYRSSFSAANARALARAAGSFDVASRVGVLTDTWAAVRSGRLPPAVILEILPFFDNDHDRWVIEEVATVLRGLSDSVIDDATRPAFRAYVRARLGGHRKALGWTGPGGEEAALARRAAISALGELAADEPLVEEADRFAAEWFADPAALDADIASMALEVSTHAAHADRLDALARVERDGATPEIRQLALRASVQFDDAKVEERALDRLLTDAVRKQDVVPTLRTAMAYIGARKVAVAWIESHFDALRAKLAGSLARGTVAAAAYACTPAERAHAEEFFTPRAKAIEGSARLLTTSLEQSALCERLHAATAPEVTRFFHGKGAKKN
jgi:aminopeptidase N